MAPDWIGLAGPTASGKSALALALAETFPLEIISVDSALVYRGMDIGTAKPTLAERAQVPHHLIDLIDPAERYSAAQFVRDATAAIADVRSRGRLPLLVGGTMLYFKALIEGLDDLPEADEALRRQLDAEAAALGWPAMHARLALIDPPTATRLAPNDAQRIQRALEVHALTGRTLSSHLRRTQGDTESRRAVPSLGQDESATAAAHATPAHASLEPPGHCLIALEPGSRADLHERIAARFEAMLAAGLVGEVEALRARGDLHLDLPSMRCVGYRQTWEALDAGLKGTALHKDLMARGVSASRQLAKRQLTWLRSLRCERIASSGPEALAELSVIIAHALGRPSTVDQA
jgi:tRNA dimethylallyltransferase